MQLYEATTEQLLSEAFTDQQLRQLAAGRMSHRERLQQEVPHLWEGLRSSSLRNRCNTGIISVMVFQAEEKKKKEKYDAYPTHIASSIEPIAGIKLYTNKGKVICPVTALVQYNNNKTPIALRGDKYTKAVPQMADILKKFILQRQGLIKKATIFYNLRTAPDNVLFQLWNTKGRQIIDIIEDWKKDLNFI